MSPQEFIKEIGKDDDVNEAYVLIREVKLVLNVDHELYHPTIRVKVYLSNLPVTQPYYFEVSHTANVPGAASAYVSSRSGGYSEETAISTAISLIVRPINEAIRSGNEPSDDWLIPNDNF